MLKNLELKYYEKLSELFNFLSKRFKVTSFLHLSGTKSANFLEPTQIFSYDPKKQKRWPIYGNSRLESLPHCYSL